MQTREDLQNKIKQRIEESLQKARDEHKKAMFRKRIDVAKLGLHHFQDKKIREAVLQFKTYLRVLEDGKNVAEGALTPAHFDIKTDITELLLISGVYWDLAKIYDRSKSEEDHRALKQYLNKFVIFSKGMSYEPVCAETLRKYISNNGPNHKSDFRAAYQQLTGSKCYVVTSLIDVTEEETLNTFRNFRDEKLNQILIGRAFIRFYYKIGPTLAKGTSKFPEKIRFLMGKTLDFVATLLK